MLISPTIQIGTPADAGGSMPFARLARGRLVGDHPNTQPRSEAAQHSYVERANLTMWMAMRRLTRLTNAFSKKLENHTHVVALYALWYNAFASTKRCAPRQPRQRGSRRGYGRCRTSVVVMDEHADAAPRLADRLIG
jgi:hypothetical protein